MRIYTSIKKKNRVYKRFQEKIKRNLKKLTKLIIQVPTGTDYIATTSKQIAES